MIINKIEYKELSPALHRLICLALLLSCLSVLGLGHLPQLLVHLANLLVLLGLPLADGGGRLRPGTITGCSWGSRAVSW